MARPIPRRTSNLELWDAVPVGTSTAWQREMLQFWSLTQSDGRRLRTPPWMTVLNMETGRNRPRTVREVAHLLAERINVEAELMPPEVLRSLEAWLADSVIVPGERVKGLSGLPAAGLSVPHFIGLPLFNRGSTRERYWATTFYLWLAADLEYSKTSGKSGVASALRDYLSAGLKLEPTNDLSVASPYRWQLDAREMELKDPEVLLTARALSSDPNDGLPSFAYGLPREYFVLAKKVLDPAKDKFTILCPGTVILLRRSLALLLARADQVGHGAMAHLVETALAHHAAQYYVRGMRVLNDLVRLRRLPDDCSACWGRFAADLDPLSQDPERPDRWRDGDYRGAASKENAAFVEQTCRSPHHLFLNAGTKEDQSAKEVGRMSLEGLRQQLGEYTVNRLWMSVAWDLANQVAPQVPGGKAPYSVADVLPTLDAIYANPAAQLLVMDRWRTKLKTLVEDKDVPPDVVDTVLERVDQPNESPRSLEDMARSVISETVLSTRYFGRYVEVLNSLLGGGALPSNQDPKGMVARGGRTKLPFHLAVNDSLLEFLVAVMSLEADADRRALSFTEFLDQLSRRYLLDIDRVPEALLVGTGLAADAISQSRQAVRSRLSAMGLLREFSDSSSWNRVWWDR